MQSFLQRVTTIVIAFLIVGTGYGTTASPVSSPGKAAAAGASVDWPLFGNDTNDTRFSSLTQVNSSNVGRLGIAWTMQQGKNLSTWETDPVVVNGTMYLTTDVNQVLAIDAATGRLKWKYTPSVDFYHAVAAGGGGVPTNRGVTVANGRVYLLTYDAKLIALQASTGEKLWSTQVANGLAGYSESSPGTAWNNMLFVGSAVSDSGMRGFVAAYNAITGKQIWRFYTVPARGHGWMPKQGQHGGGDVWMPPTIDTTTGILYFGTGNPSPDNVNTMRPGCNHWVDSTVALDARTGRFLWGHTQVCPDLWDYDSHEPTVLFYVHRGGRTIRAVGQGNKQGYYWIFNARTGATLAKSPAIVPQTCCPRPHPTAKGSKVCPGAIGGMEYTPAAYSPLTQAIYQQALEVCMIYSTSPLSDIKAHREGNLDFGGSFFPIPPYTGAMVAIDANTGKFRWYHKMPKPMIGGSLATAGNLVFAGGDDGHFYAFDARTGKILWAPNLGLPFGAAPITYMVNGTQYVAVATGGSGVASLENIPLGGTLAVFRLAGRPIHRLMAVTTTGSASPASIARLLKGTHAINRWMWASNAQQRVVIKVVSGLTSSNSGLNFNGYTKGQANFIVPRGWVVDFLFSNKSQIPHSLAIASTHAANPKLPIFGLAPVITPQAIAGIGPGITQHVGMVALPAGTYYMVCMVPGHLAGGMWDRFTVSASARVPSIQVGTAQ